MNLIYFNFSEFVIVEWIFDDVYIHINYNFTVLCIILCSLLCIIVYFTRSDGAVLKWITCTKCHIRVRSWLHVKLHFRAVFLRTENKCENESESKSDCYTGASVQTQSWRDGGRKHKNARPGWIPPPRCPNLTESAPPVLMFGCSTFTLCSLVALSLSLYRGFTMTRPGVSSERNRNWTIIEGIGIKTQLV